MKKTYHQLMEECAAYIAEVRPQVRQPAEVYKLLRPLFTEPKEMVVVLPLDTKCKVIGGPQIVALGEANACSFHIREVLRPVLMANATTMIVAHNHPTGDHEPSVDDVRVTTRLNDACNIMGLRLDDHIVIGTRANKLDPGYTSIRERWPQLFTSNTKGE